jgi:acetoacetyl-CoA reductase
LHSPFNMTCPVIEGMRERGFGRIVSISSINRPGSTPGCAGRR